MFVTQDYISVLSTFSSPSPGMIAATSLTVGKLYRRGSSPGCMTIAILRLVLQFGRGLLHDLISLLVQRDKWIVGIQQVLKFTHKDMIEVRVAIVALELGICTQFSRRWWTPISFCLAFLTHMHVLNG
jgi:hypothetical protein